MGASLATPVEQIKALPRVVVHAAIWEPTCIICRDKPFRVRLYKAPPLGIYVPGVLYSVRESHHSSEGLFQARLQMWACPHHSYSRRYHIKTVFGELEAETYPEDPLLQKWLSYCNKL